MTPAFDLLLARPCPRVAVEWWRAMRWRARRPGATECRLVALESFLPRFDEQAVGATTAEEPASRLSAGGKA